MCGGRHQKSWTPRPPRIASSGGIPKIPRLLEGLDHQTYPLRQGTIRGSLDTILGFFLFAQTLLLLVAGGSGVFQKPSESSSLYILSSSESSKQSYPASGLIKPRDDQGSSSSGQEGTKAFGKTSPAFLSKEQDRSQRRLPSHHDMD